MAVFDDVRFLRVHHKTKHLAPAFYTESWFKSASDRDALTRSEDIATLRQAVQTGANAYEWSPAKEQELQELLHWLVVAYAHEAVRVYDEWVPEEFLFTESLGVEALEPYQAFLTDLLTENGLAEREDGLVRVPSETECPPSDTLYRTLLSTEPTRWPLLTSLDTVGRRLGDLLSGSVKLEELLPERKGVVKALFSHMPQRALLTEALCAWTAELQSKAASRDAQARLRVLVLGETAGSFYTELRKNLGQNTQCTFVAVNEVAADRLNATFEHTVGVQVKTLAAWLGEKQTASYDIALLPDGLAFFEDVPSALKAVSDALLAGGLMAMVETQPHAAINLLEGADSAWWSADAHGQGICRLAVASAWVEALNRAGLQAERVDDEALRLAHRMLFVGTREAGAKSAEILHVAAPVRVLALVSHSSESAASRLIEQLQTDFSSCVGEGKDDKEADLVVTRVADEEAGNVTYWQDFAQTLREGTRVISLLNVEGHETGVPKTSFALMQGLQSAADKGILAKKVSLISVASGSAGSACADLTAAAGLMGMTRVFGNECQDIRCGTLTLRDTQESSIVRASQWLMHEQVSDTEAFVAAGVLHERFVQMHASLETEQRSQGVAKQTLAFDLPGRLDHLYWKSESTHPRPLGEDEVRISVRATGLNFRDVMWAMGLLPEEALENGFSGPTMGLEASGVVVETGSNVSHVRPGDAVVGFAPACFSTEIITKADAVSRMPEGLTFAEAASIPVVFFTSWYAISYLGRARRGESILIHGAAGGAGLAAIQIANLLGLEVYATAGSPAKRALLRRLGVQHVYNSRSLAFADEIRADTHGRGVDLVLNSLAGTGAEKSLGLLAPFGRFLELGKRDFYADTPMFLRPFRRNLSYFGIDVDQMLVDCPRLANELFEEVLYHFKSGDFRPLPMTLFSSDRVQEAFQTMQQSHHIGKIVVTYVPEKVPGEERHVGKSDLDGTVIVTGGLGGLGRRVAERLVARGARHLVLLSRSGAGTEEAQDFLRRLEAQGAMVRTPALDIAAGDEAYLSKALDEALVEMPAVSGVIHAAGVLADAAFANLTPEACEKVWRPKVKGARRLAHYLEVRQSLPQFFLMFSSATVLLGNPGQANYVAANMALEALAEGLREKGVRAQVIGWGPVGDVGMLLANSQARRMLETTLGTPPLSSEEVLNAMEAMLASDETGAHFFAIDWSRVQKLPILQQGRFEGIRRRLGKQAVQTVSMAELLVGKSTDEAVAVLSDLIAQEVAKLMGISAKELNIHQPISDVGMDSLMVVELAVALEERIGVKVPAVSLSGGATIQTMAQRFWQMLNKSSEEEQVLETMASQHGVELTGDMKEEVLSDISSRNA